MKITNALNNDLGKKKEKDIDGIFSSDGTVNKIFLYDGDGNLGSYTKDFFQNKIRKNLQYSFKFVVLSDEIVKRFYDCHTQYQYIEIGDKQIKLEGKYGTSILIEKGLSKDKNEKVLLNKNITDFEYQIYQRSDGILQTLSYCNSPWKVLSVFKKFPKCLKNTVYDFVAKYRFKIFGRKADSGKIK